jgi:hypothetical protein
MLKKGLIIFMMLAAIFLGGCKEEDAINSALDYISMSPQDWETILDKLVIKLDGLGTSLAKTLANEVRGVIEDTKVMAHQEVLCSVDFVGARAGVLIEEIRYNKWPKKYPKPEFKPWICGTLPVGGITNENKNDMITYSGYFLSPMRHPAGFQVYILNGTKKVKQNIPYSVDGDYTIYVYPDWEWDKLDIDYREPTNIVIEWTGGKSELPVTMYTPNGVVPFWLMYNGYDHFYTPSEAERDITGRLYGYSLVGNMGYVCTTQFPGTVPLYRYYGEGHHFYTINTYEAGGYGYEGVSCYVFPTPKTGTVPMYRWFYPDDTWWRFLTISTETIPDWGYEGIVFYVYPNK